jgi:hypothetical protein
MIDTRRSHLWYSGVADGVMGFIVLNLLVAPVPVEPVLAGGKGLPLQLYLVASAMRVWV